MTVIPIRQNVGLTLYENAKQALAQLHKIDEVKEIRDKAIALKEYARQAKDTKLVEWATEVRLRAERRIGEIMEDMKVKGERATQGGDDNRRASVIKKGINNISEKPKGFENPSAKPKHIRQPSEKPKLVDSGIDKNLAKRARIYQRTPEPVFEEKIKFEKERASKKEKDEIEKAARHAAREEKTRQREEEALKKKEETERKQREELQKRDAEIERLEEKLKKTEEKQAQSKKREASLDEEFKKTEEFFKDNGLGHIFALGGKPPLTIQEWRMIISCLHPDTRPTAEQLKEAFNIVSTKKFELTGHK